MVGKKSSKPRKKAVAFEAPYDYIEGVVSRDEIVPAQRKTKIDYAGIKAQLEKVLPNGQTGVLFMKKSPASMASIKEKLVSLYPELNVQLVKNQNHQVGLALAPKAKA